VGDITQTYFDKQWLYLVRAINGGISLGGPFGRRVRAGVEDNNGSNIEGSWFIGQTPAAPDTDFTIPHKLGRVPVGYLVLSIDAPGIIYKGVNAWTNFSITLRCSTSNTNVTVLVV
jgi:hypothetical protein